MYTVLDFCTLVVNGQRANAVVITPADLNVAKFEGESYLVSCKSSDKQPDKQWQDPRNLRVPSSEQRCFIKFQKMSPPTVQYVHV